MSAKLWKPEDSTMVSFKYERKQKLTQNSISSGKQRLLSAKAERICQEQKHSLELLKVVPQTEEKGYQMGKWKMEQ